MYGQYPQAGIWEISFGTVPFPSPVPVLQKIPTVFLVEHTSYFVFSIKVVEEPDKTNVLRAAIKEAVERNKVRPASFLVKESEREALQDVADEIGVPMTVSKKLPASTMVKRDITKMFNMGVERPTRVSTQAQRTSSTPASHTNGIYQFKITLNDSSPRVWRRILVPSGYSFFALHCAIQDAMGWTDSHLHAFRFDTRGQQKKKRRGQGGLITIQYPDPENEWDDFDTRDERKEHVADWFPGIAKQCSYEYDFGDGWTHTVLFEGIHTIDNGYYPRCIDGKGACPPDDCGGVGGYDDLQKILKDKKHPEHQDMLTWLGIDDAADFDSTYFDCADVVFEDPAERLKEYKKGFGV